MHTSEIDLAVCFTPWIEYLREIETKLKNTLACLSGARLGLTHEINGGRKSRDTLPIRKREIEHYNKLSEPVFFLSAHSSLRTKTTFGFFSTYIYLYAAPLKNCTVRFRDDDKNIFALTIT